MLELVNLFTELQISVAGKDFIQKCPILGRWAWKHKVDHSEQCLCLPWYTAGGTGAFWRWKFGWFEKKTVICTWQHR